MPLLKKALLRIEVAIKQCVHYCGFRYGHGEYHPYETYIARLHHGEPLEDIRAQFIDFLLHYRPQDFGQALGVCLSRSYPLWAYPWATPWAFHRARLSGGWRSYASRLPDVLTHFSAEGISRRLIEKEYGWLHGAYEAIVREGYRPERHGFPSALKLRRADGRDAFLVLDGNHRISTLSTLGYRSVVIEHDPRRTVCAADVAGWYGVRSGLYSIEDATKVFEAYFHGNSRFRTGAVDVPAIVP